MKLTPLLQHKIHNRDHADLIARESAQLSQPEQALLADILMRFDFDLPSF